MITKKAFFKKPALKAPTVAASESAFAVKEFIFISFKISLM